MKRLIALLALVAMTAACGGNNMNFHQRRLMVTAAVQREGWRPIQILNNSDSVLVVACREKGDATGSLALLAVTEEPKIIDTIMIEDVTCTATPPTATATNLGRQRPKPGA